jgi:predicted transcriptional regulator
MTTKERIENIESRLNVDRVTVKKFGEEFQIYPWLKGRLFHKEITGSESMQKKTFGLMIKQLLSVFYGCWNVFGRYDIWAFTSSMERREINGKYYDKLFDYIGNESGKKTLIIELRLFKYYPYRKIASNRAISKSIFIFMEEFYSRLFLKMPTIENRDVLNQLYKEFEGTISERSVMRKYLAQYRIMKFWLRLFPNPKKVFMSVSYTNFGYVRAFKEAGIEVVEFQHGLISKNHSAYFYKSEFNPIQFPDVIATIGEEEVDVFDEENNFAVQKVIPIGSYVLDRFSALNNKTSLSHPIKVLVALQDGVIGDQLANFISDVLPKLKGLAEITFQPRRTKPEYYQEKFSNLKEVSFSRNQFYQEVLEHDVHVTVYSTTAIEALSLGKQNVLVNIENQSVEQLQDKVGTNEYTNVVNSQEEFVEVLKEISFVEKDKVIASNEHNVKANYKTNITNLFKELNFG